MGPIAQNGLLIFIIGSACCVLIGIIIIIVRAVKIVRRERTMENRFWSYLQINKTDHTKSEKNEDNR